MNPQKMFTVNKINAPRTFLTDIYHDLLTLSWIKIILIFFALSFVINAIFATLYWLDPGCLNNSPGDWLSAFFFSVQTLGTIGYGHLSPANTYANVLVTFEAMLGLMLIAIITGFFFAKFSRAFAKIEFSRHMVITQFDGKPTLMVRMINIRNNQMVDSTVSANMLREHNSKEGLVMRRFVDLKLVRSQVPVFAMSMNIMHVIDEHSPLYGLTEEEALKENFEIIVTTIGTDSTFGQTVHASHLYRARDIVWGKRFEDMVKLKSDGVREIDYAKFHQLV
ncbi:MAG: ion channel [Bacteriovoracaceae bacterium]